MDRRDALALDLHDQAVPLEPLRDAEFLQPRTAQRRAVYDALIAREGAEPQIGSIDWDGLAEDAGVRDVVESRPSLFDDVRWEVLFRGWQLLTAPRDDEEFDDVVARMPGRMLRL